MAHGTDMIRTQMRSKLDAVGLDIYAYNETNAVSPAQALGEIDVIWLPFKYLHREATA